MGKLFNLQLKAQNLIDQIKISIEISRLDKSKKNQKKVKEEKPYDKNIQPKEVSEPISEIEKTEEKVTPIVKREMNTDDVEEFAEVLAKEVKTKSEIREDNKAKRTSRKIKRTKSMKVIAEYQNVEDKDDFEIVSKVKNSCYSDEPILNTIGEAFKIARERKLVMSR